MTIFDLDKDSYFWNRQLSEHATLTALALPLDNQKSIKEACLRWNSRYHHYNNPLKTKEFALGLCELHNAIINSYQKDIWQGWLLPSAYRHMLREEIWITKLIDGLVSTGDLIHFASKEASESSYYVSSMIDKSFVRLIDYGEKLSMSLSTPSFAIDWGVAENLIKKLSSNSRFLISNEVLEAPKVISNLLCEHESRESLYNAESIARNWNKI